jgi:thioredoxin-dependent peroxiredoxin
MAKTTAKPKSKTIAKPASKPAAKPASRLAAKPASKLAAKPASKLAAKPRAKATAAPASSSQAPVALGKKVPPFTAEATSGRVVSSKSLAGQPYVLYFYPKDDTPGCTTEGRDFAARYAEFRRLGVEVLGVSRDSIASHEKFRAKHELPFDLIADPDEKLCRLFDVIKEKSLYGRKFMGVERSTFLIDAAGVLDAEWRKVKVSGHVENVLQAARSL